MTKRHPFLVLGNWKMNPETIDKAGELFTAIRKALPRNLTGVEVVIAPPAPYLNSLHRSAAAKVIGLAAQTAFAESNGPHTGELSLPMLQSVGVHTVILGHSERRARGETDEAINAAVLASLKRKLTTVVCVGERERDAEARFYGVVEAQLRAAFAGVKNAQLSNLVIAYEPVWAISHGDGHGKTATHEDALEMKLFIQKIIAEQFGRAAINKIRILYGGSVNASNAAELIEGSDVDGFLPGGASLKPAEFSTIVKTAVEYGATAKKNTRR